MKPYQKFAHVYDQMGADEHSLKMADYCFKIYRKFKISPVRGLDLCCGTGSAIKKFVEQGIIMSGLDRSPEMLAVASKKLKGHKVKLYRKELPRFRILTANNSKKLEQYDIVTCFYDSLNYLKNKTELKTAFKAVNNHLTSGGWFVFDMNTPAALKILWGGQVFADAQKELAWIWKNDYNDKTKTASCHTTFFEKGKNDLWERFDEIHVESAYDNQTIKKLLTSTGFKIKGFYRCYSFEKPKAGSYRICVIAQKPV